MAPRKKAASLSDGGASPPAAASKKRKSEALLKDLLGAQDDGLLDATPSEPRGGGRAKASAGVDLEAGALEGSLLRALKEHSDRARARAAQQVQEELAAAQALVEAELKALGQALASVDEEAAAAKRAALSALAAEAADARAAMDKALAAFKKLSADKLAVLARVRAKVAALDAAEAARPPPNKADCDKKLSKLTAAVAGAAKRISEITAEASDKSTLKNALQSLAKSMAD